MKVASKDQVLALFLREAGTFVGRGDGRGSTETTFYVGGLRKGSTSN